MKENDEIARCLKVGNLIGPIDRGKKAAATLYASFLHEELIAFSSCVDSALVSIYRRVSHPEGLIQDLDLRSEIARRLVLIQRQNWRLIDDVLEDYLKEFDEDEEDEEE